MLTIGIDCLGGRCCGSLPVCLQGPRHRSACSRCCTLQGAGRCQRNKLHTSAHRHPFPAHLNDEDGCVGAVAPLPAPGMAAVAVADNLEEVAAAAVADIACRGGGGARNGGELFQPRLGRVGGGGGQAAGVCGVCMWDRRQTGQSVVDPGRWAGAGGTGTGVC